MVNSKRVRILKEGKSTNGQVVYWMSRDQRVKDNWALIYAYQQAKQHNSILTVVFTISTSFIGANIRHYDFMLRGLDEVSKSLSQKGIGFILLKGEPVATLQNFISENRVALLVSDFDPLRVKRKWKDELNTLIDISHHEVDAHNIIPCWIASEKVEFGAYTIRPKIKRLLPEFLTDFSNIQNVPIGYTPIDIEQIVNWLNPDVGVKPIDWLKSGESEAQKNLIGFINNLLNGYSTRRNDPNLDGQSHLSPYLHFGQISAQRVAIEVMKSSAPEADKAAFLEELIVRRELSDNFCYYNQDYDSYNGFHAWAKETHRIHRSDNREFIYTLEQFEQGKTHDKLWNAAQAEMVKTGKMHGFMRMYWAKKILEWTLSPEDAMSIAIFLNDKYSIDGRDPNGYTGIAWSIGGVHDRAWSEREVFGKIRFMNYNGCKRKFDVEKYISKICNI